MFRIAAPGLGDIRVLQLISEVVYLCLENVEFFSQVSVHLFPMQCYEREIESSYDTKNYSKKESGK